MKPWICIFVVIFVVSTFVDFLKAEHLNPQRASFESELRFDSPALSEIERKPRSACTSAPQPTINRQRRSAQAPPPMPPGAPPMPSVNARQRRSPQAPPMPPGVPQMPMPPVPVPGA